MLKKLAKVCAKFALGYLPDVALWLVKMATSKTASSEKAQYAFHIVEQIATDANLLVAIMKDGAIAEDEADRLRMRMDVLAEEIGDLL